jgi:phenylacetate-CoA ligase
LGLHSGIEGIGATVIPISGGNSERQIMVMKDFGVTAVSCTPSYFIHLIEVAGKLGIDFKRDLKVKRGVFGAEPWTDQMRQYIETASGIKAYDIYGLSEIIGPGVAAECACQSGLHVFEDHFLAEIVDPKTLEPVPDGEEGELVLTTLSKQAMPVIRYRTRDITAIEARPCACGRSIRRIRRISRRSDDMFIIRGVNVFPSQIETALLKTEASLPHYQIVLTRKSGLDRMEVRVEVTGEMLSDRLSEMEGLQRRFAHSIEQITSLHADVTLVQPGTIPRSEGKAKRVLDQRNDSV